MAHISSSIKHFHSLPLFKITPVLKTESRFFPHTSRQNPVTQQTKTVSGPSPWSNGSMLRAAHHQI